MWLASLRTLKLNRLQPRPQVNQSMPDVGFIRPGGDPAADDLASWAGDLRSTFERSGHQIAIDVDAAFPCDRSSCEDAMASSIEALFFFGHGDGESLLGPSHSQLIDEFNSRKASGKTVVSVACEAGLELGPRLVQAGARAHLGWNVLLLWLDDPNDVMAFGEALVQPLSGLGQGRSVSQVADELQRSLNEVARKHRSNLVNRNSKLAYYAAAAAAGQISVDGDRHVRPMSRGSLRVPIDWMRWRFLVLIRSIRNKLPGGGK